MATIRYEERIQAPADAVWAIVSKADSIHEWFPGITSCTVEGDHRTIHVATGISMPERIIANDRLQRRFAYQIESPLFQMHLGTIDVIELAPDECLCVYSTTAVPDVFALTIAGGSRGALTEIRRLAEGR